MVFILYCNTACSEMYEYNRESGSEREREAEEKVKSQQGFEDQQKKKSEYCVPRQTRLFQFSDVTAAFPLIVKSHIFVFVLLLVYTGSNVLMTRNQSTT